MTEVFNAPPPLPSITTNSTNPWSPHGRFGRLSYLAWNMVAGFIIVIIFAMLGLIGALLGFSPSHGIGALTAIGLLLIIPIIYFIVIFQIRRLHDINRTGWWLTLPFIDNVITSTISKLSHDTNLNILLSGIVFIINIIFMFYLMIAKGTSGINNYGDQRVTPQWEKVLGWIYIILTPVIVISGTLLAIKAYNTYEHRVVMEKPILGADGKPIFAQPAAELPTARDIAATTAATNPNH